MTVKLTNGWLNVASAFKTTYPLTLIGWVGGGTFPSGASTAFSQNGSGGVVIAKFDGTSQQAVDYSSTFGSTGASAANTYSTSALRLAVAVFTSATSRTIYVGSSTGVTDTTTQGSPAISTHSAFTIGAESNAGNNKFAAFEFAEIHGIGAALTSTDVANLLAGTVKPEDLTGWIDGFQLKNTSDLTSMGGGRTLALGGGTITAGTLAHPVSRLTPGPNITTNPSNQTVTTPTTATFTVAASATGGGSLSYQWQRSTNGGGSWANVTTGTGGTSASYTTAATSVSGGNANNADQYRCVVTETGGTNAGSANSSAATLTVNAAPSGPTINTQPSNQTVTTPSTATFTVAATASAGALSYQWQRSTNSGGSWANVTTGTGGTASSYTTAATSVSGGNANSGDQYRCAVTDSNGTVNTSAATLTVNAAAAGLTSSPLKTNAGALHLSAPFEAFVLNVTTGALVVRKTGLTSNGTTGVVTFTDAALTSGTQYRVIHRRTDTGAQGVELLTAA